MSAGDAGDPLIEPAPAAWRRIGLVAILYAYRALAGLALVLPGLAAFGAATAYYPRAQAEIFDEGGLMLLESLRLARRATPAVIWSGGTVAIVATAVGLFPLGMLIAGLGHRGRLSGAFLVGRAWAHAGTLALLFGFGLAAQIIAGSLLFLLGGKLVDAAHLVPPAEDFAFAALLALSLLVVAVVGVIRDLAYVVSVHEGRGFYVATSRALRAFFGRPARTFFAWAWRAALGLALAVLAAWLAPAARNATTGAIAIGFVLHQIALFGSAFTRASWLAAAMRLEARE